LPQIIQGKMRVRFPSMGRPPVVAQLVEQLLALVCFKCKPIARRLAHFVLVRVQGRRLLPR
jgi:hypothetical protein